MSLPRSVLPLVVGSSGPVAETEPALFGAPIAVAGIAGDQQAALFGQRCVVPGMVKNTYGTGCFMLMHTGERPVDSHRGLADHRCVASGRQARVCVGGQRVHRRRGGPMAA